MLSNKSLETKIKMVDGIRGQPIFWPLPLEVNEDSGKKETFCVTSYNSGELHNLLTKKTARNRNGKDQQCIVCLGESSGEKNLSRFHQK